MRHWINGILEVVMDLVQRLSKQYQSVSIVGLAKNAGKTVTLNYLVEQAYEQDICLGLTSTGRDGESRDLVTDTEKPSIYVPEGTMIATAKHTAEMGDAGLEILESTEFTSPLGNIIIARVRAEGHVQLAGPSNTKDMEMIRDRLLSYGVDLVIIDGAIDRKAVSSPEITDACIVSTGAVLSRDIKKVVSQTVFYVKLLTLKEISDEKIQTLKPMLTRSCLINHENQLTYLDHQTNLGRGSEIRSKMTEKTKAIYLSGAITTSLLKEITQGASDCKILIDNGTRVFSDYHQFATLQKKGMQIEVLHPITVEAVTVNPVSPYGYAFSSDELVRLIKDQIKDIEVVDVMTGGI